MKRRKGKMSKLLIHYQKIGDRKPRIKKKSKRTEKVHINDSNTQWSS